MTKTETDAERLVRTAKSQVGYQALPFRVTAYGKAAHYDGSTWDGSFLEWCFKTAEVNPGVPLTDTASALHYFIRENRLYRVPQPGDIAFFGFGAEPFGQPHVGLVTDTSQYNGLLAYKTVEGQVNAGLPKGRQDPDGVYERVRYDTDTVGFGRWDDRSRSSRFFRVGVPRKLPEKERPAPPPVTVSQLVYGKRHQSVEYVQDALTAATGAGHWSRGMFDSRTRSAYALWQRQCGRTGEDANGLPELVTLTALGKHSGFFDVKG